MQRTTPLLLAAVTAVLLSGCAGTGVTTAATSDPPSTSATATAGTDAATHTEATSTGVPTDGGSAAGASTPRPSGTATSAAAFPAGQPPRPGRQDQYPGSDTVPGLTAAVAAAQHPGLQICAGDLATLMTASGDLRGNGGQQYLVDTTCRLATGSSPDEVAVYDVRGATIERSAVLSEFTANRPVPSAYPYLWEEHTVVLAYDGGASYRLVRLTPDGVVTGLVQRFH